MLCVLHITDKRWRWSDNTRIGLAEAWRFLNEGGAPRHPE